MTLLWHPYAALGKKSQWTSSARIYPPSHLIAQSPSQKPRNPCLFPLVSTIHGILLPALGGVNGRWEQMTVASQHPAFLWSWGKSSVRGRTGGEGMSKSFQVQK
ncbi:mCG120264 [Mus musculus]|nr:mCG120264 [Mus musculus]